jgi:hypothetical protein
VATLPPRLCHYCSASFEPSRKDQRFCPGGDCKRSWFREYNQTHVHTCWHCRKPHDPEEPAFLDVLELEIKSRLLSPAAPGLEAFGHHLLQLIAQR